jgi:hypothetical protein
MARIGCRVSGVGCRVSGVGRRVSGVGRRMSDVPLDVEPPIAIACTSSSGVITTQESQV